MEPKLHQKLATCESGKWRNAVFSFLVTTVAKSPLERGEIEAKLKLI